MKGNTSRGFTLVVGLLVGGLFLWLAVRDVELNAVINSLADANIWWAVPFIASLSGFYWLKALRWSHLLRPAKAISPDRLVRPMIIGFAGNNILPFRLGELFRVYLASREFGLSKTLVLATLVLERVFDALAILVLFAAAILVSRHVSEDIENARLLLVSVVVLAAGGIYLVLKPPGWLSRAATSTVASLPATIAQRIKDRMHLVRQGLDSVGSTRSILLLAGNSILQWLLLALCIYISITAVKVQASPTAALIVLGLVVAGISIPSAPGFIGTIELCFVIGLGLFSVAPEKALAAAIFYHVLTFVVVTGAGAGALYGGQYRGFLSDFRSNDDPPEK